MKLLQRSEVVVEQVEQIICGANHLNVFLNNLVLDFNNSAREDREARGVVRFVHWYVFGGDALPLEVRRIYHFFHWAEPAFRDHAVNLSEEELHVRVVHIFQRVRLAAIAWYVRLDLRDRWQFKVVVLTCNYVGLTVNFDLFRLVAVDEIQRTEKIADGDAVVCCDRLFGSSVVTIW